MTPHAADVVVAPVHRREQLADLFRRILQIGVHRHDALARAALESGDDRLMLAVVGVEQHDGRRIGSALLLLAQQRRRAVAAAVVDEDHFVADAERVERRVQAREEVGQARLFVENRDHDGELRRWHRGLDSLPIVRRLAARFGDDRADRVAHAVDVAHCSSRRAAAA